VARNALAEDLHQQIEIGELGKVRARVMESRPKSFHDSDAAVGHRDDETIAARIDLQSRIAVERGPAVREDIVDKLGKNGPCRAGQFLDVGPRGTASLYRTGEPARQRLIAVVFVNPGDFDQPGIGAVIDCCTRNGGPGRRDLYLLG
jgi:hypothetical protein